MACRGPQALPIYDRLAITVDIGGGSTEIVLGQKARPLFTASMRLGCQRLQVPPRRDRPCSIDQNRRFARLAGCPCKNADFCGADQRHVQQLLSSGTSPAL